MCSQTEYVIGCVQLGPCPYMTSHELMQVFRLSEFILLFFLITALSAVLVAWYKTLDCVITTGLPFIILNVVCSMSLIFYCPFAQHIEP